MATRTITGGLARGDWGGWRCFAASRVQVTDLTGATILVACARSHTITCGADFVATTLSVGAACHVGVRLAVSKSVAFVTSGAASASRLVTGVFARGVDTDFSTTAVCGATAFSWLTQTGSAVFCAAAICACRAAREASSIDTHSAVTFSVEDTTFRGSSFTVAVDADFA